MVPVTLENFSCLQRGVPEGVKRGSRGGQEGVKRGSRWRTSVACREGFQKGIQLDKLRDKLGHEAINPTNGCATSGTNGTMNQPLS
eukprot:1192232-Prorocentrum_minimum.AAC.3